MSIRARHGFTANCTIGANGDVGDPQLINIVVTDTVTGYSQSNAIVATVPEPVQIGGGGGSTAANLDFVTQPEGATVGYSVHHSAGNRGIGRWQWVNPPTIVTTDLSPITRDAGRGHGRRITVAQLLWRGDLGRRGLLGMQHQ